MSRPNTSKRVATAMRTLIDEYLSALCRATTCAISGLQMSIEPSRPKRRIQTMSKDSGKTVLVFCYRDDTSEDNDITWAVVQSILEGSFE